MNRSLIFLEKRPKDAKDYLALLIEYAPTRWGGTEFTMHSSIFEFSDADNDSIEIITGALSRALAEECRLESFFKTPLKTKSDQPEKELVMLLEKVSQDVFIDFIKFGDPKTNEASLLVEPVKPYTLNIAGVRFFENEKTKDIKKRFKKVISPAGMRLGLVISLIKIDKLKGEMEIGIRLDWKTY
jgi:hypothetical protein